MSTLEKIGYILIGVSGGIVFATSLYERELRRPTGEIENYGDILDARENSDDISDELADPIEKFVTDAGIEDRGIVNEMHDQIMERAKERREEFSISRKRGDFNTKYMSMYEKGEDKLKDILNQTTNSIREDRSDYYYYIEEPDEDDNNDIPSDDEPFDDKQELVTERVEEWMEVYLGENPQDFISLVFYAGDETLCDDREQLISNPEEVIGDVALERLVSGGPGADNGVIFVRNLKTMLDYEVILDEGKYSETVLGIFESRLNKGDGGDVDNR